MQQKQLACIRQGLFSSYIQIIVNFAPIALKFRSEFSAPPTVAYEHDRQTNIKQN